MPSGAATAAGASFWRSNKAIVRANRAGVEFLVIGQILRPHGVRGEVRMRVLTDDRARLPQLERVFLADAADDPAPKERALEGLRFNKEVALLAFAGCHNRDDAERLRGKAVLIGIDQAPPLQDGEYYLFELIGLRVVADEREIGRVKEVLQTGANDVYIVDGDAFGEVLIPAHDETILNIDFSAGTITMSLPEGLLPFR